MFRKVTDIVLYKEPKINITNFLKGPKVVLLLCVINNIVLSIVSSGKQIGNSKEQNLSSVCSGFFCLFQILPYPYCVWVFFP